MIRSLRLTQVLSRLRFFALLTAWMLPLVPGQAAPQFPDQPWVLHFEDTFDRDDELGPEWVVLDGRFRPVYDAPSGIGTLHGSGELILLRRFPGDVRVEVEASSLEPGDLSLILAANGRGLSGGYFLGFGSNANTLSKLLRFNEKVAVSADTIEPGKRHRIVGERRGSLVTLRVDEREILRYNDPKPLDARTHGLVGLYLFKLGSVDSFRVYGPRGQEPETLKKLPVTDTNIVERRADSHSNGNLAGNPSFEAVLPGVWPRLPSGWVPEYAAIGDRPQLIRDPAKARRGDRFIRLAPKGSWMKLHNIGPGSKGVQLEAGKQYEFSAWLRSPQSTGATVEFHPGAARVNPSAEWQRFAVAWEAPADLSRQDRGFYLKTFGPIDIDDVSISEPGIALLGSPELQSDRAQLLRTEIRPDWLMESGKPVPGERISLEVSEVLGQTTGSVRLRVPIAELFGALPAYDFVAPDKLRVIDARTGAAVPFALMETDLQIGVTKGDELLLAADVPASTRKTYFVYLRDRDPVQGSVHASTESELPAALRDLPTPAYDLPAETVRIERLGALTLNRQTDGNVVCELTAPPQWRVAGTLSSPDGKQRRIRFVNAAPAPRWAGIASLPSASTTPGIWNVSVSMIDATGATRTVSAGFVVGAGMWAGGNLTAIASDDPPLAGRSKAGLVAARGERESFQIVIAAERQLEGVELVAGDLIRTGADDRIPAHCWRLERVEELFVGMTAPSPVLRHVNGRFVNAGNYPDPLLPWSRVDIPAGRQRVCLATLHVPPTAAPGMYTGVMTATARDGTKVQLPIELRVYDFEMPRRSSFTMLISAMVGYVRVPKDRDGRFGNDVRYYHLWDTDAQDQLATFVAAKGLTPALTGTPYGASATPWTYDKNTQTAQIDFQRFDRTAEILLEEHGIDFIGINWSSGGSRAHRPGRATTYPSLDKWRAKDVRWGTGFKSFPFAAELNTKMGLQMTSAYARALADHLEQKGWLDRVSFYIFDEPKNESVHKTILDVARTIRATHPGLRMWGAGYGTGWHPYFDFLDVYTGTISPPVRQRMRENDTRYLGRYNQPIDILAVARLIALHGWCEGWDGYYHHETTSNGDSWINPEPPQWANPYVPQYANGYPNHWMMLSGFIYHWPVDELGEPLPEGKTRAWASSLRLEALRESAEDAHALNTLRNLAEADPSLKTRIEQITTKLTSLLEAGRIPYSQNWYYNYRLDEGELSQLRREIYTTLEQAAGGR